MFMKRRRYLIGGGSLYYAAQSAAVLGNPNPLACARAASGSRVRFRYCFLWASQVTPKAFAPKAFRGRSKHA